jgi:hypothetical protein
VKPETKLAITCPICTRAKRDPLMYSHVAASEPITGHMHWHMIFVAEHAATCRGTSSNFVPRQCALHLCHCAYKVLHHTEDGDRMRRLSPSKEQRSRDLLTLEELGDRKPSQILRHLRSLASKLPDVFLRSIWANRLPSNIRAVLAGQSEVELDIAARCADRIMEGALQPSIASDTPLPENTALRQQLENLLQVEALNIELDHSRSRSSSRTPRNSSRNRHKSTSRNEAASSL